ncbi:hypothetical protein NPX13_g4174 [Xylaria arbuscula]|uniref:NACHT-NTPase and P-loop NTPases N-terminal domain-containing protein n=1 Tax=Xylaria arbuscula TaxID=114810 RepID=A0A9W8NGU6_9PEZI|nr:hypothetical protein NPX13_g4174 [Xylaria arbuscula]
MSGAEVLGVISSIVAIVDAAIKVYDAAQNTKGLPSSFLQAAARLPLLRDVLFTAQQGFDADKHWGTYASLERVLLHCKEKADALQKIFNDTMAAPEASRAERCNPGTGGGCD